MRQITPGMHGVRRAITSMSESWIRMELGTNMSQRVWKMKHTVFFAMVVSAVLAAFIAPGSSKTKGAAVYRWGPGYAWNISKNIEDKRHVYALDAGTNEEKLIYETELDYVTDVRLSPADTILALLLEKKGVTSPESYDYVIQPRNSMVFIDLQGNEMAKLDDEVQKFSWSPDGQKIAYITGTYYEGGVGFKTTGVWIFDLRDGSRVRIEKDFPHKMIDGFIGGGVEINWAKHDSNVYIEDFAYLDGVYRYITSTGKSEKVGHHGIVFSPDGKYYLMTLSEANYHIRLFRTSTDEEITDRVRARFGFGTGQHFMNWVFDQGHLAHYSKREYEFANENDRKLGKASSTRIAYNVIYDVDTDEIVKELTLPISRWTAGPGRLVFEDNGRFIVETYERLCGD